MKNKRGVVIHEWIPMRLIYESGECVKVGENLYMPDGENLGVVQSISQENNSYFVITEHHKVYVRDVKNVIFNKGQGRVMLYQPTFVERVRLWIGNIGK